MHASKKWAELKGVNRQAELFTGTSGVPTNGWELPVAASLEVSDGDKWVVADYGPPGEPCLVTPSWAIAPSPLASPKR